MIEVNQRRSLRLCTGLFAGLLLSGCATGPGSGSQEAPPPGQTVSPETTADKGQPPVKSKRRGKRSSAGIAETILEHNMDEEEQLNLGAWVATWVDSANASSQGRRVALRTLRKASERGDNEARLLYATYLASSTEEDSWLRAEEQLMAIKSEPGNATYLQWLRQTLAVKLALQREIHALQGRLTEAMETDRRQQAEILELRNKIDALTAIEETLIENQSDMLIP